MFLVLLSAAADMSKGLSFLQVSDIWASLVSPREGAETGDPGMPLHLAIRQRAGSKLLAQGKTILP